MAHPPRRPRVELNNVKHKKVLHTFSKSVWKMQTTQQEHSTRQARYRARRACEERREGKGKRCSQLGNCWKIVKQLQQRVLDRGRDKGARDALLDGYVQLKFAFLCLLCPPTAFTPSIKSERRKKTLRNAHQKQLKRKRKFNLTNALAITAHVCRIDGKSTWKCWENVGKLHSHALLFIDWC